MFDFVDGWSLQAAKRKASPKSKDSLRSVNRKVGNNTFSSLLKDQVWLTDSAFIRIFFLLFIIINQNMIYAQYAFLPDFLANFPPPVITSRKSCE